MDSDCPNHVVQNAPEIMNEIAEHQGPFLNVGLVFDLDDSGVAGVVIIGIDSDSISTRFLECSEFSVESIEQFLSAAKPCPHA